MPGNKQHMFAANHEPLFALVTLAATLQHHPAAGWKTPLVKKPAMPWVRDGGTATVIVSLVVQFKANHLGCIQSCQIKQAQQLEDFFSYSDGLPK